MSRKSETTVISITDLTIELPEGADRKNAIEDVSFHIEPGEILCIVGESGSGKSMCANAIMGLLAPELKPVEGSIQFDGQDLLSLQEADLLNLRGAKIAMIFQEPMTALNPLMQVGAQIAEVFEAHGQLNPSSRKERAVELLREVGIPSPETTRDAYPFQLSGGQRQRVMIAMALALEPKLLIADEPTTALDVTTQAQILGLIRRLQREHDMAVMFVTHDFGVVAEIADRVAVMRYGNIVETGSVAQVLSDPQDAYTKMLLAAVPKPDLTEDIDAAEDGKPKQDVILSVSNLSKTYKSGSGFFSKSRIVKAVSDVSFDLARGETLGVVGESGSGKSTVGRCLVHLIAADKGSILMDGADMASMNGTELRHYRRRIQMVFQDPYASLNPRTRIGRILTEGLIAKGVGPVPALERAKKLLELVGLETSAVDRYPHEFSGGQRQRIGIARALALEPEVIIADEAVSALDVSVQAQVLDLLDELKQRLNLAVVFITHDLRVAAKICDRIAVMQKGKIVEMGSNRDVFLSPRNDYTKKLLEAAPGLQQELSGL